ncbi:MAG: hypothetical protein J1E01_06590 [Acetatifactor sp.]|nr:hypothetical protein [Acetatifactor sp.]
MKEKKSFLLKALILIAILVLIAVEFVVHRSVPFMMDDLWYATNLVTGKSLHSLADIVESQVWHFLNWGGRCVTHGLLQLVLMCPEWVADLLNIGMTLLLAAVMCKIAGQKRLIWYLMAFSMLVSLNANWKMSMFWQAGTVNYVYSSVWILAFLWIYLRQMEEPERKALPFVNIWIVPLGLLAGWSNENMGPVCFITAVTTIVYLARKIRATRLWQIEGAVTSLLGSILVIVAPGNFVRKSALPQEGLLTTLLERLLSMLTAGADFLFPSFALTVIILLLYFLCTGEKLRAAQWMLSAIIILSFGAMVLSPHYPDRATFGTMVICIILMISVLAELLKKKSFLMPYITALTVCSWAFAVYILVNGYFYL